MSLFQISTNASRRYGQIIAVSTLYAPTLKGHIFVAVGRDTKEMEEIVKVSI